MRRESRRGLRGVARPRGVRHRRRSATGCSASSRRTPTFWCPASTSTVSAGARTARAHRGARRRRTAGRRCSSTRVSARVRGSAPDGIELAPPRREGSTGPGRHDFEIVVDPTASVEDDLARRDFTVNAMARRLADGKLVDPYHGQDDLAGSRAADRLAEQLRRGSAPARARAAVRLAARISTRTRQTLAQMREEAESVALVSGERIGGGLSADGMGELSKLLLGAHPREGAPDRARHGGARRACCRSSRRRSNTTRESVG